MTEHGRADATVDARGLACGRLEQLLWSRMREMESGRVLDVLCSEASARDGIRAWSWLTGHAIVATAEPEPGTTRVSLRKK